MMSWKMENLFLFQLVGVFLCIVCKHMCLWCAYNVCVKTSSFQLRLSFLSFTSRHQDRDPGSQLHLSQLYLTMGSLRSSLGALILVHMLLLQNQHIKVEGVDPVSQKLQRLKEQVGLNQTVCVCVYLYVH